MNTTTNNEFLCNSGIKPPKATPNKNAKEFIRYCIECKVDKVNGICKGIRVECCNDYRTNSYEVSLYRGAKFLKTIAKGKDETLTETEVEKIAKEMRKSYD